MNQYVNNYTRYILFLNLLFQFDIDNNKTKLQE